jgi:hypothetical protein
VDRKRLPADVAPENGSTAYYSPIKRSRIISVFNFDDFTERADPDFDGVVMTGRGQPL